MDTPLKQAINKLVESCENIPQLTHIKLLLESGRTTISSIVQEPATEYSNPTLGQLQQAITKLIEEENDIDFLEDVKNEIDPDYACDFDGLATEDKEELLELINEPFGKDTISHDEFLKSMARWDIK